MAIVAGIQARNSEVGAIRCGDQIISKNGKPVAHKLPNFRLTGHSRKELQEAADLWGGEVTPWNTDGWGKQFQVYTQVNELPMCLPPGDLVIRQDMELYAGGGLQRRCDGRTMSRPRPGPCQCPQPDDCPWPDAPESMKADWAIQRRKELAAQRNPEGCKPLTRISMSLPDIGDALGVWVLRTRSEQAAAEIMTKMMMMEQARARGVFLSARVAMEQRQDMLGGVLRQYPVPVIRLDDSLRALAEGTAGARSLAEQLPPRPAQLAIARPAHVPLGITTGAAAAVPDIAVTAGTLADEAAQAATRDAVVAIGRARRPGRGQG